MLTMCLHIDAFRVGSIRLYLLPSWKCLLSLHISNVFVNMQMDTRNQEQIDSLSGSEIQNSRSSRFTPDRSLNPFLIRFVLWAFRFIDVRVDNVFLQLVDESVLTVFSVSFIE